MNQSDQATARSERPRRRGRFIPRRKVCAFCVDHLDYIDYKDPGKLRRYVSERGKIEPRRKTGTCARHQRTLTQALKRARHIALLPFTAAHIRDSGGFAPRPDRFDRDRGDRFGSDRGDRFGGDRGDRGDRFGGDRG